MVRFDGVEFKLVNIPLPDGQSQQVKSLCRARDDGMWVSVSGGHFGFYDGQKFFPIENERWAQTSVNSTTVFEATNGAVWTGSDPGMGRWVKGKPQETFFDTNYANVVLCFWEGAGGRVWMGTAERGLSYWQNDRLIPFPDESLKKNNILGWHRE
jgi:ligand-binding sensor domain-containing protein